ncbi:hypothetical protein [Microbispora catharanthi]|uniref:hypothetical protein n=1 Tax=Microbispora catharanthi TaxID=1712871 RepID=UPI003B837409
MKGSDLRGSDLRGSGSRGSGLSPWLSSGRSPPSGVPDGRASSSRVPCACRSAPPPARSTAAPVSPGPSAATMAPLPRSAPSSPADSFPPGRPAVRPAPAFQTSMSPLPAWTGPSTLSPAAASP